MTRFVFITGGVLSSVGKGIAAASIGALFEGMGHSVSFLKLDPYLNIDPGTMSPSQHGEVFVTDDGAETDLDLGHYERFTDVHLRRNNSVTAGKLYAQLLDKERRGDFLGGTIQTVPHFTNEIKQAIMAAGDADFVIVEIGGTIGDIEGLPFIEAIRQIGLELGKQRCLFVHVTYIPYLATSHELKTKPTQHSVKTLCSMGVQPDMLICRAVTELPEPMKKKLALFTNVDERSIISAPDLDTVYALPLCFAKQGVPETIKKHFGLLMHDLDISRWETVVSRLHALKTGVTIGIVGKYTELRDAYKSLIEALVHAQIPTNTKVEVQWIDAQKVTPTTVQQELSSVDGVIIPGGFGERGIEGKIIAARYAREHAVPFLGICLGMQVAVIEFARNVLGLAKANSTEFDPKTPDPVIDLLPEQKNVTVKGGSMRLGTQPCVLTPGSKAADMYGTPEISERHRHRYEYNQAYVAKAEKAGLQVVGKHATSHIPEMIELSKHPFFIGCQFHPELRSKPYAPHPLFVALVKAAVTYKKGQGK